MASLSTTPSGSRWRWPRKRSERVQFSVPGESLEYFLIYGPTPKEVLSRYTALTGRPALPPPWSFGLWLTTSFTTDYDEATVTTLWTAWPSATSRCTSFTLTVSG